MILVDTSVWIDHLRQRNDRLKTLLETGQVIVHPFIVGELALGNLRQRDVVISSLLDLPQAVSVANEEVLGFIARHALSGKGIGLVDAHLLASARLNSALLWTRDKRLKAVATQLGMADAS
jgi:predicted nucleic acid-binding protein